MLYIVNVYETHVQPYSVEANSPDHAKELILAGEGELLEGQGEYVEVSHIGAVQEAQSGEVVA